MQEAKNRIPPYVPYRTFRTFLDFLQENKVVPDRIDRSVWREKFSGSSGSQLMNALRSLQLVDKDGTPLEGLKLMVEGDRDARRQAFRRALEQLYTPLFRLDLATSSRGQFREAFKSYGLKEAVTIKCEAFFIHAARDAGVELSKFITRRRHGSKKQIQPRTKSPSPEDRSSLGSRRNAVGAKISERFAVAELILKKYPDFDVSWSKDVQASWLAGMEKIYEMVSETTDTNDIHD